MSFERRVRSLDIFKKIPNDISRPTNLGGLISILTVSLIFFLIFKEVAAYLHPQYFAQISNDKLFTREEMTYSMANYRINLDITFPSFPCQLISLDLDDVMGSHHPNIGSVQKWRLSSNGSYLDSRSYELLRQPNPIRQLQAVRQAFRNHYGCRLMGSFTVKEVPGNFHISCHAYFNHYMQVKMEGHAAQLNMSHVINQLYFGREHHLQKLKRLHPQAQVHKLRDSSVMERDGRSYNYHIDIVPTWYHEGVVNNYYTYQYTYHNNPYKPHGQPGVVHFNYHIGGLIVEVQPKDEDFTLFIIHLCAILGGTYALCKAAYNLVSNFLPKFQYELISD